MRDSESIWIERPHGFTLVIAGPGKAREHREFPDEQAMEAYQMAVAERLAEAGWFLWDFNRDRRLGSDRRGARRSSTDRRDVAADRPAAR